jgi:hypothetical protein
MLGWDMYGLQKKHAGTHYAELVILHPVGSVCHKVHSSVSGVRNIDALLFMLVWDRYGFHQKRLRTHYAELEFLHPVGSTGHVVHPGRETSMHYFSCSGGTGTDFTKSVPRHVTLNMCFSSGRIYGSRSSFQCDRGVKR